MGRGIRVSIDKEPVPNFSWREREREETAFFASALRLN